MGGVLIEFNPNHLLNLVLDNENDKQILLQEIFKSKEWKMMDKGELDEPQMYEIVSSRIPEHLKDKAHYLIYHWNEIATKYEDVSDYIQELKNRGYKIYLLSNASHRLLNEYWLSIKNHECFDGEVVSAFVGLLKPNKDIYEYLLDKFSLKPEECAFVDDSIPNVDGAIICGMQGIKYNGDINKLRYELEEIL